MLSDGSPVAGSVIASRLCQVSRAQRISRELDLPLAASRADAVPAAALAVGSSPRAARRAVPPTSSWRRPGVGTVLSDMVGLRSWWLLDAGGGDALDEPALEGEEDQEDRHDDDRGPGEEQAVVRGVLALGEQRKGDREGVGVLGLGDDERPEEVVPAGEERQDAQRRECGTAERQDDAPEDPQLSGPVDPSRVEQVPWQALDVLPHQEHAERGHQERQEQ